MPVEDYAQYGFPVSMAVQRALRLTIELMEDLAHEETHPQSLAMLSVMRTVALDALDDCIEQNRRWAAKNSVRGRA